MLFRVKLYRSAKQRIPRSGNGSSFDFSQGLLKVNICLLTVSIVFVFTWETIILDKIYSEY